jgi:hypothetical protein
VDAEQEYLLRKLLEGYLPAPAPEPSVDDGGPREHRSWEPGSGPIAVREALDAYERVFFAEGATLAYVRSTAAAWQATGLSAPEVHQWLDAGVYPDEPQLAAALAGAGFDPREARRTTIRYRSDSESMNVISAVRGRTGQADWAIELRNRIRAVQDVGPGTQVG